MRIALIGVGEVGRSLAPVLAPLSETPPVLCEQTPTAETLELARRLGSALEPAYGDWLTACDVVLCCVGGTASAAVAEAVATHGRPGQILLDLATAPPQAKRIAADRLAAGGQHYVDIAIMGAVAIGGAATPLLAAGPRDVPAVRACSDRLIDAGLRIRWLDDGVAGDAASLKLLRSVFTKGLEALAVECLTAAEHFGVRQPLYDVLSDVDSTPLPQFLEMLVTTHLVHAGRRLAEIEQAEAQLHAAGLPVRLLPGVRALFAATAAATHHDRITVAPPPDEALRRLTAIGTAASAET